MSKYTMRQGVNNALSQRLFAEYLQELAQKKISKQPKIVANKNK